MRADHLIEDYLSYPIARDKAIKLFKHNDKNFIKTELSSEDFEKLKTAVNNGKVEGLSVDLMSKLIEMVINAKRCFFHYFQCEFSASKILVRSITS